MAFPLLPARGSGASTTPATFFSESFEQGLAAWTQAKHGGASTCAWALETARARSPTRGAQCGDGATYAPGSDTDLISRSIDLSNATSAELSFYEYADGEAPGFPLSLFVGPYDYGTVSVSGDDGATWTQLETDIVSAPQWTNDTLDLSQASGVLGSAVVRLKFRWVSDASVQNAGWFLDDLKVWGSANVTPPPPPPPPPGGAAVACKVFATREGLVGGTTANGHTIVQDDRFVALPSGRALASDGGAEYRVRVLNPANGKSVIAPVWDIGPWNTHDDYWAPSAVRQTFADLAQCKPEAQAAYQDGYHGGTDGSGRTVTNPAGIDLADGTFQKDLGLTDNGWVNVTYLGTQPTRTVASVTASTLNARTGPGTGYATEGTWPSGARVAVFDQDGGWDSFSYAGKPAWSSASYLQNVSGARYLSVGVASATMRDAASATGNALGTVAWPEAFALTTNGQNDGCGSASAPWCEVWWNGRTAWIDAYDDGTLATS